MWLERGVEYKFGKRGIPGIYIYVIPDPLFVVCREITGIYIYSRNTRHMVCSEAHPRTANNLNIVVVWSCNWLVCVEGVMA